MHVIEYICTYVFTVFVFEFVDPRTNIIIFRKHTQILFFNEFTQIQDNSLTRRASLRRAYRGKMVLVREAQGTETRKEEVSNTPEA